MNEPTAPEPIANAPIANAPLTDGRRAEGEPRRRALIEATLRVIARDGAAGVTHRSVAHEAELPTTAATSCFESVDALLTAVLTSALEMDAERVRQLTADPVDGPGGAGARGDKRRMLARMMAGTLEDRGLLLAEFELFLLAARRPELRGRTHRWYEALADFARLYTPDPMRVSLFARAYDGLLLQALQADEPPTAEEFEVMLWALLPDAPG
ncbi:TetR/AcrR family transcriptional regulator [Streptomyces sp. NPDC018045]|uniref:TetR/AcrR family transcriptional regulator n=1 Tax=Streptomyces sp. NPDC018045 TaxID=3365037 RepID=UPI0037ABA320